MRRLLFDLTAPFPVRFIKPGGRPYIERYYIGRLLGMTIYLQRFVAGDVGDEHVHDHPWRWAIGIPLAGGYVERIMTRLCSVRGVVTRTRFVRVGNVNFISGTKAHQIVHVLPETWTLFIHGGRYKGWGFYRNMGDGHISYGNAVQDREDSGLWWTTAPVGEQSRREPFTYQV